MTINLDEINDKIRNSNISKTSQINLMKFLKSSKITDNLAYILYCPGLLVFYISIWPFISIIKYKRILSQEEFSLFMEKSFPFFMLAFALFYIAHIYITRRKIYKAILELIEIKN